MLVQLTIHVTQANELDDTVAHFDAELLSNERLGRYEFLAQDPSRHEMTLAGLLPVEPENRIGESLRVAFARCGFCDECAAAMLTRQPTILHESVDRVAKGDATDFELVAELDFGRQTLADGELRDTVEQLGAHRAVLGCSRSQLHGSLLDHP